MTGEDLGRSAGVQLARKVAFTAATGLLTFVVSATLDKALGVSLPDQLVLSTLVGGITLLTQFLHDFDQRVKRLEHEQSQNLIEARRLIDNGFARITEATRFFSLVEGSALDTGAITQVVRQAGLVNEGLPELLQNLAHHELDRVTSLLKSLNDGNEAFYDGEDREWLLGLARSVRSSISATSLATVDAGLTSFEGGLWMNDLGGRYLDLQRAAIQRGVSIRRIFVFDDFPALDVGDFARICRLHQDSGVDVRQLDYSTVPLHLKNLIFDFVLFDEALSYEVTPATKMDPTGKPAIVTTRLVIDQDRLRNRGARFEALWEVAHPIELATLELAVSRPGHSRPDRSGLNHDGPGSDRNQPGRDQAGSTSDRPANA